MGLFLPVLTSLALFGLGGEVQAQVEPQHEPLTAQVAKAPASVSMSDPISFTGSLSLASDYSTRGVSQTGGGPVVQGGIELSSGYFYAGTWGSNVDFGDGTKAELDGYVGVRGHSQGMDWDLRALGYAYVGQPDGADYNYVEFRASVAKSLGPARLGAVVFYTPDYFGPTSGEAVFAQATGAYDLGPRWNLSAGLGNQWVPGSRDYSTWHIGPTYKASERVSLDLRYYDTDQHDFGSSYDRRLVVSLKTTL